MALGPDEAVGVQNVGIKYLVMPIEIIEDERLSQDDRLIFSMINLLDTTEAHCFAGNEYFSRLFRMHVHTVSRSVKKLITLGYIIKKSFDGRRRTLMVNPEKDKIFRPLVVEFNRRRVNLEETGDLSSRRDQLTPLSDHIKTNNIKTSLYDQIPPESVVSSKLLSSFPESVDSVSAMNSGGDLASLDHPAETPTGVDRSVYKDLGKTRLVKKFVPTDRSKYIVDYWNSKPLLHKHREGTKTYKNICLMIERLYRGSATEELFKQKKFNRRDMINAINEFHLASTNRDYEPSSLDYKENLRKTNLLNFLYRGDAASEKHKSLFLYYLNNPAQKLNGGVGALKTEKEDEPVISLLAKWYEDKADDPKQMNPSHFQYAIHKLKQFQKENSHKFIQSLEYWGSCYGGDGLTALTHFLIDALDDEFQKNRNGMKLTSGWLCSSKTFEERLPRYLSKKAFIKQQFREGY